MKKKNVAKKSGKNLYKYVPIRMSVRMYNRIKKDMENSNEWSKSKWIREAIKEKLAKEEILYRKMKKSSKGIISFIEKEKLKK